MRNEGTTFKTDDNQINIISATENKAFEKKPKMLVAKTSSTKWKHSYNARSRLANLSHR